MGSNKPTPIKWENVMAIRDRPEWANNATEPLLEVLYNSEYPLTMSSIQYATKLEYSDPPGRTSLYNTKSELLKHGYIDEHELQGPGSKLYSITSEGREFLDDS